MGSTAMHNGGHGQQLCPLVISLCKHPNDFLKGDEGKTPWFVFEMTFGH
jgi:hypothetical protein